MSVVVTGGAGFIGSCLVRMLNDNGIDDIIIVDNVGSTEKWKNLVNKKYRKYVHKTAFIKELDAEQNITHILHMGACSSTTEQNFDYLYANNFEYTKYLWDYAAEHQISFIYASSAATYGNGDMGFSDTCDIGMLRPMNGYGYSKQLFDLWAERQSSRPKQYAGLKFFNVYGPNEYCKGSMASMVFHGYRQIKENGRIRLFKSYQFQYPDGGQMRDFVYVKDICNIVWFLMQNEHVCGLFNAGTGRAETFERLAKSIFSALGLEPRICYIDMPESLMGKYQYYTKADMQKLAGVGYSGPFHTLKDGVADYVQNYLDREYRIY